MIEELKFLGKFKKKHVRGGGVWGVWVGGGGVSGLWGGGGGQGGCEQKIDSKKNSGGGAGAGGGGSGCN